METWTLILNDLVLPPMVLGSGGSAVHVWALPFCPPLVERVVERSRSRPRKRLRK